MNSGVAQRSQAKGKRPQSRHAYMYARRHTPRTNFRHQKQYACECNNHMNAEFYAPRMYMHMPHLKMSSRNVRTNLYKRNNASHAHGRNRFTNVRCFYRMTLGHTSNVCYYKKLHMNLLSKDFGDVNQPRPLKVWVQKNA